MVEGTLTAGTQGGHGIRDVLAKDVLKIDPARIRVVTPDVGGADVDPPLTRPDTP